MKKTLLFAVVGLVFLFISSCSNSYDGGNSEKFSTVYLYATFESDLYEADAYIGTDSDSDGICDVFSITEDDVEITITSTTRDSLPSTATPSTVEIVSYEVEFIPQENSPDVISKQMAHNIRIEPDSTKTVAFRIIDQEDKVDLSSGLDGCMLDDFVLDGSGISYEYIIELTIYLEEISSGIEHSILVEFPLHYYDIADDCMTYIPRSGC